jgi:hypothetical protein
MEKGKAFVLVGHEQWGKTQTLIKLTGSKNSRNINISGKDFKINRPSNDDISEQQRLPNHVIKFIAESFIYNVSQVIITLCPNFENPKRCTMPILEFLKYKYDIYFWVMRKKWGTDEVIYQREIDELYDYGVVEIFEEKVRASIRAKAFRDFIENNL